MASKITVVNGEVTSVYDDRLAPLFHALGTPDIERATDVEYDPARFEWVATHRETGTVIARGLVRADVIRAEVQWLEERM